MRTLLVFFFPVLLSAQSDFLNNPDIVWAAEIEQDFVLDLPSLENEWDEGLNTIKLLKTDKNAAYWSNPYFAHLVFQGIKDKKLPIFKDPECREPAALSDMYQVICRMVTYDPDAPQGQVYPPETLPDLALNIHSWRIRQVLAYHKKSATWSTYAPSIAPLVKDVNAVGDTIGTRPVFWFRADNKPQSLNAKQIVWAKQVKNRQSSNQVSAEPNKLLKITQGNQNPMQHLLQVCMNDANSPFYSLEDRLLTYDDRLALISKTDTVVTFDPETYEEKVMIVRNDLNPSDVKMLRLVQSWYWDERRQRLSVCLDAVAPLIDVRDWEGNFRYSRPLFYRRSIKKGK